MLNYNKNNYKYPNDIKWIKSHLLNHVDNALEEISQKVSVYKVDGKGNVIFNTPIIINDGDESYNITEIFEEIEHVRQEITQINNLSDIESVINNLNVIRQSITDLENNLIGITRDAYQSTTNINDETKIHNNLSIDKNGFANASIIGYGVHCGLLTGEQGTKIRCVKKINDPNTGEETEKVAYWIPPTYSTVAEAKMFDVKTFYLISLLSGVSQNNIWSFNQVKGSIIFNVYDESKLLYGFNINISNGKCIVNKQNTDSFVLTANIDNKSSFTRGEFSITDEETGEEILFNEEIYSVSSSDQVIKFITNDYKLNNDGTDIITSNTSTPKLYIDPVDFSFDVINNQEEGSSKYSAIKFYTNSNNRNYGTYLNAYIPTGQSGPTNDEKTEFAQNYNIDVNVLDNLSTNGLHVQSIPTEDKNSINFLGSGNVQVGENKSFNIRVDGQTEPIITSSAIKTIFKTTNNNNQNNMLEINQNGLNANALIDSTLKPVLTADNNGLTIQEVKTITFQPGTHTVRIIHDDIMNQTLFDFDADAQFTYIEGGEQKTVKISQLLSGTEQRIKELENRIITLERQNWFMGSTMVDNPIYFTPTDAIKDEDVFDKIHELDDEDKRIYHIDEDNI